MKPLRYTLLAVLVLGLPLTSCSSEQAAPPNTEGWFSATIRAPVATLGGGTLSYAGGGVFRSSEDPDVMKSGIPGLFFLFSNGVGSSAGQNISITHRGAERLVEGKYPIDSSEDDDWQWYAQYVATSGDSVTLYIAIGGDLEITTYSAEQVEGHFTLRVIPSRTCDISRLREPGFVPWPFVHLDCTSHEELDPPVTEISGSFSVVNGLPCDDRGPLYTPGMIGGGPVALFNCPRHLPIS
jgi:hypothetical protein